MSDVNVLGITERQKWAGISLAALTGILHLIEAPEYYAEVKYIGVLFVANAIGGLAAAYGIWRGSRAAWALGFVVAGGAFIAYLLSRTIGLPSFKEAGEMFEPMGVISLLVEGAFVAVSYSVMSAWRSVTASSRSRVA